MKTSYSINYSGFIRKTRSILPLLKSNQTENCDQSSNASSTACDFTPEDMDWIDKSLKKDTNVWS